MVVRLIVTAVILALASAAAAADRVGVGDDRSGYARADYRSDSRRVVGSDGQRLDLAALARNPPLGLPPLPELPVAAAVDLGRRLFFDRRLSVNGTLSCAMCHVPEQAFTQNELATPVGLEGRSVRRNAPALYNVGYRTALFRDGRAASLEAQVAEPLLAANEMGNPSVAAAVARIADDYAAEFEAAFDAPPGPETLARALASYQRALLSADSPWDRWYFRGEPLSAPARRGFELFSDSGCTGCHTLAADHALFSDGGYHDTGIAERRRLRAAQPQRLQIAPGVFVPLAVRFETPTLTDDGRMEVTGRAEDRGRYRTPSLRNVALTAPYMHDGSLATLEDVVRYYAAGGTPHPGQDPRVRPLALDAADEHDLVAFLQALTGSNVDALAADARSVPIGDPR
jgi:cytochrome c peroxidase